MDFYHSPLPDNYTNKDNSDIISNKFSPPPLLFPDQWPQKLVEPNVWPNFLWRSHPQCLCQNICLPIQASFPELVDLLPIQLSFSALYFLIWLAAIVGNASVLYVVSLKQVQLSSVRSVFICSLAASDILMSFTSLPITAISIFTRDWVFPSPFCKLMGIFQGGTVFVSSFTLTAIAVDRYILIKHPTKQKIEFRTAICIVIAVWILGYACALPVGLFSSTQEYPPFCGTFCEENWPDTEEQTGRSRIRKMYGLLVLIVQFGLPTVISSLCYWNIGRLIRRQIQKRKERQLVLLQESKDRMKSQKNRTNRMMVTMVAGLVLAWLPMNLINLWRDFNSENSANSDDAKSNEWFSLIFAACHSVAMTSAVWNPLIYSFFNPQFKETIRASLERRRKSQAVTALLMTQQQNNANTSESRRTSCRSLNVLITNNASSVGNRQSDSNHFLLLKNSSTRKHSAQIGTIEEEKNSMLSNGGEPFLSPASAKCAETFRSPNPCCSWRCRSPTTCRRTPAQHPRSTCSHS